MQSPFIFLHNKKLALPQDSEAYESANSTLYRKEAFKFIYMGLLCKLYDMSSLPMIRTHKVYIYTGVLMSIASVSFYISSIPLTEMLINLDTKYEATYRKHIKDNNFEGII